MTVSQAMINARDLTFCIGESVDSTEIGPLERNQFGLTFAEQQDVILDVLMSFDEDSAFDGCDDCKELGTGLSKISPPRNFASKTKSQ
jgi:hypothetical protein